MAHEIKDGLDGKSTWAESCPFCTHVQRGIDVAAVIDNLETHIRLTHNSARETPAQGR